ncbi:MAG TPA: ClpXP protease specificity-enhancing factor SspB [Thermoanaerobaculia bacterium]
MSPPEPGLDYPRWIAEALRLVARRALEHVETDGLPGEHHFLLSFRSRAEGVRLPAFLRDQYPDEVTVVLQNQFWDMVADDEGFSVTLAFAGARHRIFVPWPALTAFADPGAQLALRFEMSAEGAGEGAAEDREAGESRFAAPPSHPAGGPEGVGGDPARVVSLDRFRKRREGDDEAG